MSDVLLIGVVTFGIGWSVAWAVLAQSAVLDQDRRGWHDKLAGTVVVTKASLVARTSRFGSKRA